MRSHNVLAVALTAVLGLAGLAQAQNATPATLAPTLLYYHDANGDTYMTATLDGQNDAKAGGYRFARVEGFIFNQQMPDTAPLLLYWHAERGDTFTLASAASQADAVASGYSFLRLEGFVYPQELPGTVPLLRYVHEQRGENFTTSTAAGQREAQAAGYTFVRVEGYVFPPGDAANAGQPGQTTIVYRAGASLGPPTEAQNQPGFFALLPGAVIAFLGPEGGPFDPGRFGPNRRRGPGGGMGPGGMGPGGMGPGGMGAGDQAGMGPGRAAGPAGAGNPGGGQAGNAPGGGQGAAVPGGLPNQLCYMVNGQRQALNFKNPASDGQGNATLDYCIAGGSSDGKCGQLRYANCRSATSCTMQACRDGTCSQPQAPSALSGASAQAFNRSLNPFFGAGTQDDVKNCNAATTANAGAPAVLDPPCSATGGNGGACVDPAQLAGTAPAPLMMRTGQPAPPAQACATEAAREKEVTDLITSLRSSSIANSNPDIIRAATSSWNKANEELQDCLASPAPPQHAGLVSAPSAPASCDALRARIANETAGLGADARQISTSQHQASSQQALLRMQQRNQTLDSLNHMAEAAGCNRPAPERNAAVPAATPSSALLSSVPLSATKPAVPATKRPPQKKVVIAKPRAPRFISDAEMARSGGGRPAGGGNDARDAAAAAALIGIAVGMGSAMGGRSLGVGGGHRGGGRNHCW